MRLAALPRPRSIRGRFALALGTLLLLSTLNIGAFYWGARQRDRVFAELARAISRHGTLTEAKAGLDDHYKRVRVLSDLVGVENARIAPVERAQTVQAIHAIARRLAALDAAPGDTTLARLHARTDSLARSWEIFYATGADDPAQAITEVALRAEPLAHRLISTDLPAAIRAEGQRVNRARELFVRTDRTSSQLVWAILLASGILTAALAYSLSRDLLRAVAALKAGADRFGAGELGYQVAATDSGELDEVGASLNAMARRLRRAHDELQERNEALAHLAFRDPLTRLSNRALFRQRVQEALTGHAGSAADVAVLFLDLDNFKATNDSLGHAAGDHLLEAFAERLLAALGDANTVARLGGDEFGVLLVGDAEDPLAVAERVIAAVEEPFELEGRSVHAGVSIGVVTACEGQGADELLRDADVAMYRAKGDGKGRFAVFAPEMHRQLLERLGLEAELRSALARDEFFLEYQPIVELSTGRIRGFEALARWRNRRSGIVSPAIFIPLAEECGVILSMGRWTLLRACEEAVRLRSHAPPGTPLTMSVNVSGRQLEHPEFVSDVLSALDGSGMDPQCLILEITESVIMRDSAAMLRRLQDLKALGVRLAIDDFGTGYSSLAYLQRFPIDILKIDKAFVDPVARGAHDAALARMIVALGEMLGLSLVAEGIEEVEQCTSLLEMGCRLGQGYLFARPLGAEQATALLRSSAPPLCAAPADEPAPEPPRTTATGVGVVEPVRVAAP